VWGNPINYNLIHISYFLIIIILDLCVGLLNVLTDIIWRITISWRAGNLACKVIRFSQVCVTYSSTYVLVAMSIDRYDAITHPMNFSKSCESLSHKTFLIGKCLALDVTRKMFLLLLQGNGLVIWWLALGCSPLSSRCPYWCFMRRS